MDHPDHNSSPYPQDNEVPHVEYAGFWIRTLAVILDTILLMLVAVPLLVIFYGPGVFFIEESPGLAYDLINYALPIVAFLLFWQYRSADPGKLMMGIYIADADTFEQVPFGRLVLRYIAYYISALPFGLGFIWAAFDKRKQGFHDKIARTVVLKRPDPGSATRADDADNNEAAASAQSFANKGEAPEPANKQDPWKE